MQETGLDRKTEKSYLPRHVIAVAATGTWSVPASRVSTSNDPRGWVCTGNSATPVFLRATKRTTAYKEVGGSLRLPSKFAACAVHPSAARKARGAEASNRSRKSQCPSPPWDTAFPGAFFLRGEDGATDPPTADRTRRHSRRAFGAFGTAHCPLPSCHVQDGGMLPPGSIAADRPGSGCRGRLASPLLFETCSRYRGPNPRQARVGTAFALLFFQLFLLRSFLL